MTARLLGDTVRFLRASATNQIARVAPSYYVRMTRQTGRGESSAESAADIAAYFSRCYDDYVEVMRGIRPSTSDWLLGKTLLEYGPGDLPGVALLMIAHGAQKVFCVDRFPMLKLGDKNVEAVEALLRALPPAQRARAAECFVEAGNPGSGFRQDRIEYLIRPSGLSGLRESVDLVISRAVLEHVNDLAGTFADMEQALRPGGLAVHQVDLKSHGLHRDNPLDFLAWPPWMWQCMFSEKGAPNRWRVDRYRAVLAGTRLRTLYLTPTLLAEPRDVAAVRPALARRFRGLSDDDLAWLGFWLVCERPAT